MEIPDRIVTWAGESGKYVIIDWDYTGNPIDGSGDEMPDISENPLDYSAEFWKNTAEYFKNTRMLSLRYTMNRLE